MKTKTDLTHNQFKSPLDGSWHDISFDGFFCHSWAKHDTYDYGIFRLERKTKRGLLNTLHRMNIQTRKAK